MIITIEEVHLLEVVFGVDLAEEVDFPEEVLVEEALVEEEVEAASDNGM